MFEQYYKQFVITPIKKLFYSENPCCFDQDKILTFKNI